VIAPATGVRLLEGPALATGAESFADHVARLGPPPSFRAGELVGVVEAAELRGRGGAGFPRGLTWSSTE
jgi:hypothetical protein